MDVPEDIEKTARKIAKEAIYHGGVDWATADIARALLAQDKAATERAAKIAEETVNEYSDEYDPRMPSGFGEMVAAAIRSQP